MSDALRDQLAAAVRAVLTAPPRLTDEADLQRRLVAALGTCDVELPMVFDPPAVPPRQPPPSAVVECAAKGRPLESVGKDPCWASESRSIVVSDWISPLRQ